MTYLVHNGKAKKEETMVSAPRGMLYANFQFVARLQDSEDVLMLTSAFVDPFRPEPTLVLGSAHATKRETLKSQIPEEGILEVYLLPRSRGLGPARRVTFGFSRLFWAPIDLDMATDSVAIEWLGLRYSTVNLVDVNVEDLPPCIEACVKD